MMHQDFRPEVLAMCHTSVLLFQFRQVTVPHTVFPCLSLIYGVDSGKMLLRGNPLMYHYTIQEAVGVTLLCPS